MEHKKSQPITVCISGVPSPGFNCPPEGLEIARTLGRACASKDVVITSTSTTGFPLWVALAASRAGTQTLAFSPAASFAEHVNVYSLPTDGFSNMVYTGFGTAGASVLALRSSDAIIFGCGGMTSIMECVTAIEQNKPVGILKGPWDIDEALQDVFRQNYPDYENLIVDEDPKKLLEQVIKRIKGQRDLF